MSVGLLALLDDVASIAKVAAACLAWSAFKRAFGGREATPGH